MGPAGGLRLDGSGLFWQQKGNQHSIRQVVIILGLISKLFVQLFQFVHFSLAHRDLAPPVPYKGLPQNAASVHAYVVCHYQLEMLSNVNEKLVNIKITNTSAILNHRRIYVAFLVLVSTCEQSSCSELSAALALLDCKTIMEQSAFFPAAAAAAALHFVALYLTPYLFFSFAPEALLAKSSGAS